MGLTKADGQYWVMPIPVTLVLGVLRGQGAVPCMQMPCPIRSQSGPCHTSPILAHHSSPDTFCTSRTPSQIQGFSNTPQETHWHLHPRAPSQRQGFPARFTGLQGAQAKSKSSPGIKKELRCNTCGSQAYNSSYLESEAEGPRIQDLPGL